jgi:hypothetical protein
MSVPPDVPVLSLATPHDSSSLCISPFQEKRNPGFRDQPASGALGRDAIAIEKSDRFQVLFFLAGTGLFLTPGSSLRQGDAQSHAVALSPQSLPDGSLHTSLSLTPQAPGHVDAQSRALAPLPLGVPDSIASVLGPRNWRAETAVRPTLIERQNAPSRPFLFIGELGLEHRAARV